VIRLIDEYFKPMARRVYGDAALPEAMIARLIAGEKPEIVNASQLRKRKLAGLRKIEKVLAALDILIEGNWLRPIPSRQGEGPGRQRADYLVNPRVLKGAHAA
jgi:hypothetical protein